MRKKSVWLAIYSNKFKYGLVNGVAVAGGDSVDDGGRFFFLALTQKTRDHWNELETAHIKRFYPSARFLFKLSLTIQQTHSKQMANHDTVCG